MAGTILPWGTVGKGKLPALMGTDSMPREMATYPFIWGVRGKESPTGKVTSSKDLREVMGLIKGMSEDGLG